MLGSKGLGSSFEFLSYQSCLVGLPIEDSLKLRVVLGFSFKNSVIVSFKEEVNVSKCSSNFSSFNSLSMRGSNKAFISCT